MRQRPILRHDGAETVSIAFLAKHEPKISMAKSHLHGIPLGQQANQAANRDRFMKKIVPMEYKSWIRPVTDSPLAKRSDCFLAEHFLAIKCGPARKNWISSGC